jgi:hypothetical protein
MRIANALLLSLVLSTAACGDDGGDAGGGPGPGGDPEAPENCLFFVSSGSTAAEPVVRLHVVNASNTPNVRIAVAKTGSVLRFNDSNSERVPADTCVIENESRELYLPVSGDDFPGGHPCYGASSSPPTRYEHDCTDDTTLGGLGQALVRAELGEAITLVSEPGFQHQCVVNADGARGGLFDGQLFMTYIAGTPPQVSCDDGLDEAP